VNGNYWRKSRSSQGNNVNNILITGGSGSFGTAFTERLLTNNLSDRICIYSRDEFKQAQMRQRFNDDQRLRFFVGDVRDLSRLKRAMIGVDIVIHAAALKRIEVGNYAPDEMVKTNIMGAINVIEATHEAKVKKVICLSTDKAYKPVSPYGQTKALAESLFLNANNMYGQHGPKYSVTRYGNVAGSKGSVIPKWRELKEKKKIITVTAFSCTRFWMFMDEAVDLVLKAIKEMKGGETFIPELPAFNLINLLKAMDINTKNVRVAGLPEWEKVNECMADGNCSNTARQMTIDELREALKNV